MKKRYLVLVPFITLLTGCGKSPVKNLTKEIITKYSHEVSVETLQAQLVGHAVSSTVFNHQYVRQYGVSHTDIDRDMVYEARQIMYSDIDVTRLDGFKSHEFVNYDQKMKVEYDHENERVRNSVLNHMESVEVDSESNADQRTEWIVAKDESDVLVKYNTLTYHFEGMSGSAALAFKSAADISQLSHSVSNIVSVSSNFELIDLKSEDEEYAYNDVKCYQDGDVFTVVMDMNPVVLGDSFSMGYVEAKKAYNIIQVTINDKKIGYSMVVYFEDATFYQSNIEVYSGNMLQGMCYSLSLEDVSIDLPNLEYFA